MSDSYSGRPRSDSSEIAYRYFCCNFVFIEGQYSYATLRRKIFIGGLSYSTDEGILYVLLLCFLFIDIHLCIDTLKSYFRPYGIVQDAVVMKDPGSRRSRGFGFITFYDAGSVETVFNNEPHYIDGRKVRIEVCDFS